MGLVPTPIAEDLTTLEEEASLAVAAVEEVTRTDALIAEVTNVTFKDTLGGILDANTKVLIYKIVWSQVLINLSVTNLQFLQVFKISL